MGISKGDIGWGRVAGDEKTAPGRRLLKIRRLENYQTGPGISRVVVVVMVSLMVSPPAVPVMVMVMVIVIFPSAVTVEMVVLQMIYMPIVTDDPSVETLMPEL